MGRFILLILIGTLVSLLVVLNPNEEDFSVFMSDTAAEVMGDAGAAAGEAGGGALGFLTERLGREAGEAAGSELGRRASGLFERSNYVLGSVYTLDLNGRREGGEWTFVGVASQFFPISEPDDLPRLLANRLAGRIY